MPHTFTRRFRIRHYECDAFGNLNNASYVRYMQETAFDAYADAGFDKARYEELDHYWLIRETDIQYKKSVHFGDRLNVKTWILDCERVRSRRMYQFTNSSGLIAEAVTDWVFLTNISSKPAIIPSEILQAFFPEGPPESFPPREKFPKITPPPKGKYEFVLRVAWRDIDPVQHVNNAIYIDYVEECGLQAMAAQGWPISRMMKENISFLTREYRIQYRSPALYGDDLVISSWISSARQSIINRHYLIQRENDGEKLVKVTRFVSA